MQRKQDINLILSSGEDRSLKLLQSNISGIQGIKHNNQVNDELNSRGGGVVELLPLLIAGFAIPAFLKAVEVFLTTRKIEIEIQIPDKKAKLKLSGVNTQDLKKKIEELRTIIGEE